nr:two-component system activity regulator YycH [Liquorilactobacillus satsumensis]
MKIRNFLLHSGLIITILISVLLSALIWINPAVFQRDSKTTTSTGESSENVNKKKLSDVFLPLQTTLNQNGQSYVLFSDKNDVTGGDLSKQLGKLSLKDGSLKTYKTDTEYQEFLQQNDSVLLSYTSSITTALFNQVFSQKLKGGLQEYKFNRILIPLQGGGAVYLVSDQNRQAYKLTVKKDSYTKIKQILNTNGGVQKLSISYFSLESDNLTTFYTSSFSLPRYSYLVNKSNISPFLSQLLNSNGQSSITTKVQKNKTIYSDGTDNRMEVNDQTGEVVYENYADVNYNGNEKVREQQLGFYDLLKQSFTQLNALGVQLDDVRYAEYSESDNTVTYRSYIAGFPIINEDSYATYKIQPLNSGGKKYVFSLNGLQVPVPSGGAKETLPATETVYQELENAGYSSNQIKSIKVAYQWEQNTSSKLVVDLVPTYFVNYNGHWQSYTELLKKTASGN